MILPVVSFHSCSMEWLPSLLWLIFVNMISRKLYFRCCWWRWVFLWTVVDSVDSATSSASSNPPFFPCASYDSKKISTVHLHLMRVSFFSETALAVNMALFTLTFFAFRLIICPYLWWGILQKIWKYSDNSVSQACIPWHFKYVVLGFGTFFNCLNAYWAVKIVKKLMRKLNGKEKVKDRNDLKDR